MANIVISPDINVKNIKLMHCINGGPLKSKQNQKDFKEIVFPYMRNHDASFCESFGGEHIVDITAIFPDFEKDAYDTASYDFVLTDEFISRVISVGGKPFYRLGQKIEHWSKKYGSNPPKDFKKWAVICEHIIKHYNEGWNEGFNLNIEYWEIWNEPDNIPACWTGTLEQYYEMYEITASHLKKCFPHIKIGGAAFAEWSVDNGEVRRFVERMSLKNIPIDFLSWHTYSRRIEDYKRRDTVVREALDEFGYTDTESILNEWNYLINWRDGLAESQEKIRSMEGAACVSAVMSTMQDASVDMLMYYFVQPGVWNGVFDFYTEKKLKGYYSLWFFSKLYKLQTQVKSQSDDCDIYVISAKNGEKFSAIVTYYTYDNNAKEKTVSLDIDMRDGTFLAYMLNEEKDAELIGEVGSQSVFTINPNSVLYLERKQ